MCGYCWGHSYVEGSGTPLPNGQTFRSAIEYLRENPPRGGFIPFRGLSDD